jgi:hypothetical protein
VNGAGNWGFLGHNAVRPEQKNSQHPSLAENAEARRNHQSIHSVQRIRNPRRNNQDKFIVFTLFSVPLCLRERNVFCFSLRLCVSAFSARVFFRSCNFSNC